MTKNHARRCIDQAKRTNFISIEEKKKEFKSVIDDRERASLWYTPKRLFEENYSREGVASEAHLCYEFKGRAKY